MVQSLDADSQKREENLRGSRKSGPGRRVGGPMLCRHCRLLQRESLVWTPTAHNLSPRFFDEAVENARKIIDAVKPKGQSSATR